MILVISITCGFSCHMGIPDEGFIVVCSFLYHSIATMTKNKISLRKQICCWFDNVFFQFFFLGGSWFFLGGGGSFKGVFSPLPKKKLHTFQEIIKIIVRCMFSAKTRRFFTGYGVNLNLQVNEIDLINTVTVLYR